MRTRTVLPLVAGGLLLGGVGGWLWWLWWGPSRTGTVYQTDDGPKWYDLTDTGLTRSFDATADYAVIGLVLCAVLGILAAWLGRRWAYAALGGLLLGCVLGAAVAYAVGVGFSPPDPQTFATADNVDKEFPSAIEVVGWTPYLCWPLGGLLGFLAGTLVVNSVEHSRRAADAGDRLEARPARSEQSPLP
jgi:hypothetical protein